MSTSQTVAIASDIHFPHHHTGAWAAFREWHSHKRPYWTILVGDVLDFSALSRYRKSGDEPLPSVEIKMAVHEINALAKECTRLTFVEGNHEDRFREILSGVPPHVLEGLHGLTLREQMLAHGLNKRVEWYVEQPGTAGIAVAQWIVRHGHKQAGKFGGGLNPATKRISDAIGVSEVFGHHHVAQHSARAAHNLVAQAVANPCMESMQNYAGSDPRWPMGFTVLHVFPGWQWATAQLVVMDPRGAFALDGKVYGLAEARKQAKLEDNKRTRAREKSRKRAA